MPGTAETEEVLDETDGNDSPQEQARSETVNSGFISKVVENQEGEQIWVKHHATSTDMEATEIFIKIVGSHRYQYLLKNKKTLKFKVWEDVYEDMVKLGYNIAKDRKEGGLKCSQKWRNLERSYVQFVGEVQAKTIVKKMKKPPIHYELLHEVLKDGNNGDSLGLTNPLFADKEQKCQSLDVNSDASKDCNIIKLQASVLARSRHKKGTSLWVKRNPSAEDLEATDSFIKIVGSDKYQALLHNRKTRKSEVWQAVYEEMMKLGYNVADNKVDGGVRCSQKWRNLERAYIQYITSPQAGRDDNKRKKKPPVQYDMLHAVLKDRIDIINSDMIMESSSSVELLEPEIQSTFTSNCDTNKECHIVEIQSDEGDAADSKSSVLDTSDETKEEEYIIVELSPDVEDMLKDEQQHTENEGSQKESTSISKAMQESSGEQLWATNHATATDMEATAAFIKIVGSDRFQSLLNDGKTRKSQVWQQVCHEMIKLGFHVSDNLKDGGVKCAQKWRNLERSYIQYVGHIKTAGVEKRKKNRMPPLNYEELHAILKGRNFTNYGETTMTSGTSEYEQRTYNSDIDMPEDLPTPFSSSRNIKTSEATAQDVLDFVVNEAKKQEKQFAKLCEILTRQNDEKKRLTDAIIAYLGQPIKPRKRKASDTDSD